MARAKARAAPRAAPRPQVITIRQPTAPKKKRATPRRKSSNVAVRNGVAALAGGAAGALVGGLLVKAGVKPTTAAVGVTVAGGVGAFTLTGTARHVSTGVAAAGAGQLALGWLAKVSNEVHGGTELPAELPPAELPARNADVANAFRQAQHQFETDDYEDEDVSVRFDRAA